MISVENLIFTYSSGEGPVLKGLNFNVEKSEIFGFLGPSGAGKSTTQKILIGLLRQFQGNVSVLGKDLAKWDSGLYEKIGVSFEMPNHYLKLTGNENLKYFSALYSGEKQNPETLLEMVGLNGDGNVLVSHYSKGMKNRLNVARSLLHNPELLFLDEPTVGLDPVNSRRIKDLIQEQKNNGKTVFLTTHDMAVVEELCDRVAFLINGEIVMIDEPSNLKLQYGKPTVKVDYQLGNKLESREFPIEGLAEDSQFLDLLRQGQIKTIHSQEANLETVFIKITGQSLI